MNRNSTLALLVALGVTMIAGSVRAAEPRQVFSMDADWRFHPGEVAGTEVANSPEIAVWLWEKSPHRKSFVPGVKS